MLNLFFLVIISLVLGFMHYTGIELTNKQVGAVFVIGLLIVFIVFALFKFGLHYKINALNKFCHAFYYSVFEYKKKSQKPLGEASFQESLREQAEIAMSANFDPEVAKLAMKVPVSMYTKDSVYMPILRARIKEAERLKYEARELKGKASKLLQETEDLLVDKKIVDKSRKGSVLDSMFGIQDGVQNMIELTVNEVSGQNYNDVPDYEVLTHIALDNNPYYATVYRFFRTENVTAVLNRAPFMIILLGIIGTFAGFYLALSEGGDIKAGAAVAIVSSLVALPVSLSVDYINTLFPDASRYRGAFDRYKLSLELLFNYEKERYPNRGGRRHDDPPREA